MRPKKRKKRKSSKPKWAKILTAAQRAYGLARRSGQHMQDAHEKAGDAAKRAGASIRGKNDYYRYASMAQDMYEGPDK